MSRRHQAVTIKYLSEAQIAQLFRVIESPRDRAMFRLIYHRGLRASEIRLLQMSDLDVANDRILITRLKGSSGGSYKLCRSERLSIHSWIRTRGTGPGPLFPTNRGEGPSRQYLDKLMRKYSAMAGLPEDRRHCHCLKHSCGTHLLNQGLGIEDVQDHLGHRNISNTLVYAAFTNQRRAARERRIDAW